MAFWRRKASSCHLCHNMSFHHTLCVSSKNRFYFRGKEKWLIWWRLARTSLLIWEGNFSVLPLLYFISHGDYLRLLLLVTVIYIKICNVFVLEGSSVTGCAISDCRDRQELLWRIAFSDSFILPVMCHCVWLPINHAITKHCVWRPWCVH